MGNILHCCELDATNDAKDCPENNPLYLDDLKRLKAKRLSNGFYSKYELGNNIGMGSFSRVVQAFLKSDPSQIYAVKIVGRNPDDHTLDIDTEQEINTLRTFKHPNIIKMIEFIKEPEAYYIVLEYMAGGELFDQIARKNRYYESEARNVLRSLLRTVDYMHQYRIAHRDLKPHNILLSSTGEDAIVKIADFGFATHVSEYGCSDVCGTAEYMAPEVVKNERHGLEADLWSVGVIAFVLLSGKLPFDESNMVDLFNRITQGFYYFDPLFWQQISIEAKDFIAKLLTVDKTKRLTAQQALQHPWMVAADHQLNVKELQFNLEEFRRFNIRRKWRKTGHTIIALNKWRSLVSKDK